MLSDLQILNGSVIIAVVTLIAVEALSLSIRRVAEIAGVGRTVICDIRDGMRMIAASQLEALF
jgi:hypothetical protein